MFISRPMCVPNIWFLLPGFTDVILMLTKVTHPPKLRGQQIQYGSPTYNNVVTIATYMDLLSIQT